MLQADAWRRLPEEIAAAKVRFGLSPDAQVVSCYGAGLDGFWVHRYLSSIGVVNVVVDSSSIEVDRRARRTKTDRLDAEKWLAQLLRYLGGVSLPEAPSAPLRSLRWPVSRSSETRLQSADMNVVNPHGELWCTAVGPPVRASQSGGAESDG
jgi:transposase